MSSRPVTQTTIDTLFGTAEIPEEHCWHAHAALPGFPDDRRFVLLDLEPYRPLTWLQSLDDTSLCFPLARPACFSLDYPPPPTEALFGFAAPDALLLNMVVFDGGNGAAPKATPHARAPLCFDPASMRFVQWILANENACGREASPAGDAREIPLPAVGLGGAA